jgi:predicted RNase H-like nuclease (RuvC/YqgF family)
LVNEVEDLRHENIGLKDQLRNIKELEGEIDRLSQSKSDLSQQVDAITSKFLSAKDDAAQAKRALADLAEKSKGTGQTQNAVELLEAENIRLRNRVNELEDQATDMSSVAVSGGFKALKDKISELENHLKGWTELANVSFKLSVTFETADWSAEIIQRVQSLASSREGSRKASTGFSRQEHGDQRPEDPAYSLEGRPVQWWGV